MKMLGRKRVNVDHTTLGVLEVVEGIAEGALRAGVPLVAGIVPLPEAPLEPSAQSQEVLLFSLSTRELQEFRHHHPKLGNWHLLLRCDVSGLVCPDLGQTTALHCSMANYSLIITEFPDCSK
uniref:Predicted protein n=1 Tax=Hordeum vulgare subsp. vulgare TaxID=112509 RepID=F2CV24_HORVV|nr:predicted protein [Hordeum vulgare subsp. vulgare]